MRTHILAAAGIVVVTAAGLVAQQPPPPQPRTLVWVDRSGAEQPLSAPPQVYSNPRISPDGRRLSVSIETGQVEHVWTCDLPMCGNLAQFTKTGTVNSMASGRRTAADSPSTRMHRDRWWRPTGSPPTGAAHPNG